ncbi:MAG: tetratricopeptide repeat-containing sensor histidine kinase [Bacteroidetes bacterium]|nr:MAG: tetratricopeptide repeat-containing sensor histidine kinase [Bacteroidota bacterium]
MHSLQSPTLRRLLSLILFSCLTLFAQASRLDSLSNLLQTSKDDSVKLAVSNQIIWMHLFQDQVKAWELIEEAKVLADRPNQEFGRVSLINVIGVYYDVIGELDSSLKYFKLALDLSREYGIEIHEEHSLNNLGLYHWNRGNLNQALEYFLASKKINEKLNGENNQLLDGVLNNIGLIYQELFLYEKALQYHKKAYEIRIKREPRPPLMASLNNLGICFKELNKVDSARFYLLKGLALREKTMDESGYFRMLSTLSSCYAMEGDTRKAIDLSAESFNRPETVPYGKLEKARDYNDLAQLYVWINNADSSLFYGKQGLEIIQSDSELIRLIPEIYLALANAYLLKHAIDSSSKYNELYLTAIENTFNKENAEMMQEMELKYETAKKDQALAESKLALAEKTRERNLIVLISIIGLLVLIIFFNNQRLKNKRLRAEVELKAAMIRIESQNQLQEQRIEISRNLHDTLGAQLTFIISAIDNLKIFDLNREKLIVKYDQLSDFTRTAIFELRDTIWAMNKEQITFEDLKGRISNFVQQAKASVPLTKFEFTFPADSPFAFQSKDGIEIFRIIQEAVNNAIKHAEASEIHIEIKEEPEKLSLCIRDNGKGFDLEAASDGHGISSMKNRAAVIGAELSWKSEPGETRIELHLNKA